MNSSHTHECPQCKNLHPCKNESCEYDITQSLCKLCWKSIAEYIPENLDKRGDWHSTTIDNGSDY